MGKNWRRDTKDAITKKFLISNCNIF